MAIQPSKFIGDTNEYSEKTPVSVSDYYLFTEFNSGENHSISFQTLFAFLDENANLNSNVFVQLLATGTGQPYLIDSNTVSTPEEEANALASLLNADGFEITNGQIGWIPYSLVNIEQTLLNNAEALGTLVFGMSRGTSPTGQFFIQDPTNTFTADNFNINAFYAYVRIDNGAIYGDTYQINGITQNINITVNPTTLEVTISDEIGDFNTIELMLFPISSFTLSNVDITLEKQAFFVGGIGTYGTVAGNEILGTDLILLGAFNGQTNDGVVLMTTGNLAGIGSPLSVREFAIETSNAIVNLLVLTTTLQNEITALDARIDNIVALNGLIE